MPPEEEQKNEVKSDSEVPNPITQPTNSDQPKNTGFFTKKLTIIGIVTLIILIVAGLGIWKCLDKQTPKKSIAKSSSSNPTLDSVLCVSLGVRYMQCENLETQEVRKYVLPLSLGQISEITPSPDDKKFFMSSWTNDISGNDDLAIYDNSLKQIYKIPVKYDKDHTADLETDGWLDKDSVLYHRPANVSNATGYTLYTFSSVTGAETKLIQLSSDIESLMPAGDGRFVYGIKYSKDSTKDSYIKSLVVIDLKLKTTKDVDSMDLDVDQNQPSLNQTSSLFYASILNEAAQKSNIEVFKVDDLESQPKLSKIQEIDNADFYSPTYGQVVTTKKGIFAGPEPMPNPSPPLRVYTATNKYTELSMAVGNTGNYIIFSLTDFPNFKAASSNQAQVSDFFEPPKDAPKPIVDFLTQQVTSYPDCKKGEYITFELGNYDGPDQFSVSESGCQTADLAFFIKKNGQYKLVKAIQEGMACEERDRLGISKKVLPDTECSKPGDEGL